MKLRIPNTAACRTQISENFDKYFKSFLQIMFLSSFARQVLGFYSIILVGVYFWWGSTGLFLGLLAGIFCSFLINVIHKEQIFEEIIAEILIPEFIDKRPFRESDRLRKDEILQEILHCVNDKVNDEMGIKYEYTDTRTLLLQYNTLILDFEMKYLVQYKNKPVEDIRGWDKIMLIAKNIQDEDLNSAYENVVSSDLINKYSTEEPTIPTKFYKPGDIPVNLLDKNFHRKNGVSKEKHFDIV